MRIKFDMVGETVDADEGMAVISFDSFDMLARCAHSVVTTEQSWMSVWRGEERIRTGDVILVDSLLNLPYQNRRLSTAYASKMISELDETEELLARAEEILACTDGLISTLGAAYRTEPVGRDERDIKSLAKWLSLVPARNDDAPLPVRFLRFLDYVCDSGLFPLIVVVGLFANLAQDDIPEIVSKGRFEKIDILFLETLETVSDICIPQIHIDEDWIVYDRTL